MIDEAMRVLVSSKYLAKKLAEIDFDKETVERVALENEELTLITASKAVKINVSVIQFKAAYKQTNRGWNHVYRIVSSIADEPVILRINEYGLQIIFQY